MRRLLTLTMAAMFVMALATGPAGAQAELNLVIDPEEGFPGQNVVGFVTPESIEAGCITDSEEWAVLFGENWTAWFDAYIDEAFGGVVPATTTLEGAAVQMIMFLNLGITLGLDDGAAWAASFAFVMADIATQEPFVIEGFDPETGEAGPLTTPFDVTPGLYAIAAACNSLSDFDELQGADQQAGIESFIETQAILEVMVDEYIGGDLGELPLNPLGDPADLEFITNALTEVGGGWLPSLFTQDALGVNIYCVLDESGECPSDEPPPGSPADPIGADPAFTG